MDVGFIGKRITALRLKKKVSEVHMSNELGKSDGYIQSFSSGRALPSMTEFLNICKYLDVTPMQFFDADAENPALLNEAAALMQSMGEEDFKALIDLLSRHIKKDEA